MGRMHTLSPMLVLTGMLLAACTGSIAQRSEFTPTVPILPTPTLPISTSPAPLQPTPIAPSLPAPTTTPTSTRTAVAEANAGPVIHYFRANVLEANPGDTIVFEWASSGGTQAILYHLAASGQLPQSGWDVATTGTYTYQIGADERNASDYVLFVLDQSGRNASANLRVKLRCLTRWFFAPAPEGCPTEAVATDAAEQHFERGTMVWIKGRGALSWTAPEKDHIFILYGDKQSSPRWEILTDERKEGTPERDAALTPPPGLYQPVRGFGLVWRTHFQTRERLGWAVDQEQGYSTMVQMTAMLKYNSIYLRALDGNVWHLAPEGSQWEKIQVVP